MSRADSGATTIDKVREDSPTPSSQAMATGSELMSELTSYLGTLGLGDNHLAKVISLMQATQGEESPQFVGVGVEPEQIEH